ncbi:hypothetical protein OE88DRAFT_1688800, partial [Heliocybe sulcata]
MANVLRRPKSSTDWNVTDLVAYNIRIIYQDAATFFGAPDLPLPHVHDEIITALDAAPAQNDDAYILLRTMHLAMSPREQSAVVDFVAQLFKVIGYTGGDVGRVVRTRKHLPFYICGEQKHAHADVCLLDDWDNILLVVQENKWHMDGRGDPEAQLIADAIAAFQSNTKERRRKFGQEAPASKPKVIPGLTITGTMPTFYKVPVTPDLVRAVQFGEYPTQETVVCAHVPALPRPAKRYSEGMKVLDNRRILLGCYEAFKQFL